jgi:hypothetical protein
MIGLFLCLVAWLPAASMAARISCDQSSARCDADYDVVAEQEVEEASAPLAPAPVQAEAPPFATPAVIDCRAPVVATLLQALVGECDGTTHDASYRASRDPDSERAAGSLRPARHDRGVQPALAACAGVPSEGGGASNGPPAHQPLALFAVAQPPPAQATRFTNHATFFLPFRSRPPLERPPRA